MNSPFLHLIEKKGDRVALCGEPVHYYKEIPLAVTRQDEFDYRPGHLNINLSDCKVCRYQLEERV